jgi:hypothetical protein
MDTNAHPVYCAILDLLLRVGDSLDNVNSVEDAEGWASSFSTFTVRICSP